MEVDGFAMRQPHKLSPKQIAFIEEYLVDLNSTQAALRAGYSPRSAFTQGCQMLAKPHVAQAIAAAKLARSERTQITQDRVLTELWLLATADPNELVEFRRTCCRFCHGQDNGYQRVQWEMDRARVVWQSDEENAGVPFNEMGGVGYDACKPPRRECQHCFGDGVGEAVFKDTRNLSKAALRLYAGVKQTKGGLEVKMHDQQAALMAIGKHLGMFVDKHEHLGPNGGPLSITMIEVREQSPVEVQTIDNDAATPAKVHV